MKVHEIMKDPISVDANTKLNEAAKKMAEKNIGSLLITNEGDIIGIITERDILNKVVARNVNTEKTTVKEAMTSNLISVKKEDTVEHANMMMAIKKIRRLIVKDDDEKIVGIITVRDVSLAINDLILKKLLND